MKIIKPPLKEDVPFGTIVNVVHRMITPEGVVKEVEVRQYIRSNKQWIWRDITDEVREWFALKR